MGDGVGVEASLKWPKGVRYFQNGVVSGEEKKGRGLRRHLGK